MICCLFLSAGRSALDVAIALGCPEIIALLRGKPADFTLLAWLFPVWFSLLWFVCWLDLLLGWLGLLVGCFALLVWFVGWFALFCSFVFVFVARLCLLIPGLAH